MTIREELQGKVALVTGATRGMGEAIARLFALEGAQVLATGRSVARGEALCSAVTEELKSRNLSGSISFVAEELTDPESGRRLVQAALDRYGKLDILVPNAGELGLGKIDEITSEQWRHTLALNLDSVFHLCNAALPVLRSGGGGNVVINGSIAAWKGFPGHAAYCASKSALVGLTKQLARDYGRDKIRINMMAPGPIDTPLLHESIVAFPNPESIIAETAATTALGRIGVPQDVAQLALFLASDRSSFITGVTIPIDGGISAG